MLLYTNEWDFVAECGIFKFLHFIAVNWLAVQKSAGAKASRIKIIQNGIVDDANAYLLLPYECHGNGDKWNAPNEIIGAINGIDDPSGIFG